jgi:hypothetical protein
VALTEHDLRTLPFEENESFFVSLIGDLETARVAPKCEARGNVVHVQLGHQPGKSAGRRSVFMMVCHCPDFSLARRRRR